VLATGLHAFSTLRTLPGLLLGIRLLTWTGLGDLLDHACPQVVHLLIDRSFNFGSGRFGMRLSPGGDRLTGLLTALLPLLAQFFPVPAFFSLAFSSPLRFHFTICASYKNLNGTR
jgi:hypothetical protein